MRILISLIILAMLTQPAFAQSRKELAAQNAALAQRLLTLESRMLTGDPAAERLMARVDQLESSQRTLTGEVERLRYERDNLRAELKAVNDDFLAMTADLQKFEGLADRTQAHLDSAGTFQQMPNGPGSSAPYVYGGNPSVPPLAGGTPQQADLYAGQPSSVPSAPTMKELTIPVQGDYQALDGLPLQGKQKLAEGDFLGAQTDFKTYLASRPDAPDAGDVNFWLGETYYVRQGYADAADAYIASMRADKNGVKAPDAMIRLAAALRGLGKQTEACQTLDSFLSQYPSAPANVRAKHRTELARTGC